MHAATHALLAGLAGALAVSLAQSWHLGEHVTLAGGGTRFSSLAGKAFFFSVAGLGAVTVKGIAGVYATYVQAHLAGEVGAALRLELLDSVLTVHRLHRPRHGDHGESTPPTFAHGVAALTERVQEVELGLKVGLLGGLRAAAQLVPLAVVLAILSGRTALIAAIALLAFGALLGRVRSGYRRAAAIAGRERGMLIEAADESVRHAELWVSYGAEGKARGRLTQLGEAIAGRAARLDARAAALSAGNEVLAAAALALAVGASQTSWFGPACDGATLLAFAVAFFLAYRPMRELTDARLALARADAAFQELRVMIHPGGVNRAPAGRFDASGPSSPDSAAPAAVWPLAALELRGLRLLRGGCRPLTLRIEPGSLVAITGPTGIGKTTLLRTLLGLERARDGEVYFAGAPIGDAPAGPRSRPFAWVPQDAPLVAGTLDANIALGADDVSAPAALDPLGAPHLARALARDRLGGGGRAVSGGERQWIALARAIATRQPVLLLDEPTSGLDAEAQRRVLDAVARLRGRRTVLLVTHRSEPLDLADVVVRLEAAGPLEDAA